MPINFFEAACKTTSTKEKFGLCDDPSPAVNPAYIDETDSSKWIANVENSNKKEVDLYAVDHCIDIRKPDGNLESRCDGMLHYENRLIFVELKTREGSGWLSKARQQLTTTISIFKINHTISDYDNVSAYACNKLRPAANQGNAAQIQQFKDDTGLILKSQQDIAIL